MAANAIITLPDGEATPVDHDFSPIGIFGEIAKYQNLASTYAAGRETVQFSMKETSSLRKVVATMAVPRVLDETINGVTVSRVADFMQVKLEFLVPRTWAESDIKNGRMMANALTDATAISNAVDIGEYVW